MNPDELERKLEEILANKLLGMTEALVARYVGSERLAAAILRRLLKAGRINSVKFCVKSLPSPAAPLYRSWEATTTPAALERETRKREDAPLRVERVFFVGREFRRPLSVDHEVGVAEVWLWYRAHHPGWVWIGEADIYPKRRPYGTQKLIRVPDAVVLTPAGKIAIDYVSSYRGNKLADLISFYSHSQAYVGLELW